MRVLAAIFLFVAVSSANPTDRDGRIVNGQIAAPNQFPYQVALLTSMGAAGTGLCGGSVISRTAILTAAHCSDARAVSFLIIFGAHNRTHAEPNQQRRTVPASGWVGHPNYNAANLANDIAIIRFPTQPINYTPQVQPIDIASGSELFTGELVHVSGFGRFDDTLQQASDVVRFTVKNVISNASCALSFTPVLVQASTICAVGDTRNNSACHGDSGGPLAVRRQGRSVQVGVVSFGSPLGCGRPGVPVGYARVTSFHSWIVATAPLPQ